MLAHSLLLLSLSALQCRAVSPRINKLVPTITGSFVNFGKIEVVVHVNPKQPDSQQMRQSSLFKPQLNSMFEEDPCPCNGVMNGAKSLSGLSNPSSKLYNMLFGPHQKDQSSGSCCDSSEHIHEETIIYDIGSNPQSHSFMPKSIPMPYSPNTKEGPIIFPLEFIFPNNMQKLKPLPLISEEKPTTTRRPPGSYLQGKKSPVKFVGGNNDILEQLKNLKFRQTLPVMPVFHKNTVKKDLNLQKVADEVNSVVRVETTIDAKTDAQTTVTDATTTMAPTEVSYNASASTV